MSKRISSEDSHAIDLLLERPDGHGDRALVEIVFARPIRPKFEERLDAVEKILSVLDAMPTPEPADDLVSRTLQAIEAGQIEPRAARPADLVEHSEALHH